MKTFSSLTSFRSARARIATSLLAAFMLLPAVRAQIAAKAVRTKVAGIDFIAYPTGVKNVVTIRGAFPAGDSLAGADNPAVPTLTGMLLDKGTTK